MPAWLKPTDSRRLRAIFGSDGSEIREQFIFAGLLLTIFERFKKYVVDHVDGSFFRPHRDMRRSSKITAYASASGDQSWWRGRVLVRTKNEHNPLRDLP